MTISPLSPQNPTTPPLFRPEIVQNEDEALRNWIKIRENLDRINEDGWTELATAAHFNQISYAKTLLENKAGVDVTVHLGNTPLIIASSEGHTELAELLLDHSAKIEHQNEKKSNALVCAIEKKHIDSVKLLIKRGAIIYPLSWALAIKNGIQETLIADKYKPFATKILYHKFNQELTPERSAGELIFRTSNGEVFRKYTHLNKQPGEIRRYGKYKVRKNVLVDGRSDEVIRLVVSLDTPKNEGPDYVRHLFHRTIYILGKFKTGIEAVVESVNKKGRPRIYIYQKNYRFEDLYHFLKQPHQLLSDAHKMAITRSLLEDLVSWHEQKIAHRDIKPDNVLLDGKLNEKGEITLETLDTNLSDYDLFRREMETPGSIAGTRQYFPPEYSERHTPISFEEMLGADVWAMGLTLYNLWNENKMPPDLPPVPIYKDAYVRSLKAFQNKEGAPFPEPASPIMRLIWQMLQFDPQKRPKLDRALLTRHIS